MARKIVFSFTNGQVGGSVKETVEYEDGSTDEEIDEDLNNWLYERSQATWYDAEDSN